MAADVTEELGVVTLNDNFYRDSFGRVIIAMIGILLGLGTLIGISIYLFYTKPTPTTFFVDREYRVLSPVPIDQPYLTTPDMLQWVAEYLPKAFVFDFVNYNAELQSAQQYFTANGWQIFLNHLNNYVNPTTINTNKQFVTASASGAPYVLSYGVPKEGPLAGRYVWWVQIPVTITYAGLTLPSSRTLTMEVLVVRISTLNNLNGIAIDNVIVKNATG